MSQQKPPLKLYTKTGDAGESGLANGIRQPKSSLVFDVLGTTDELNAHLGLAVSQLRHKSPSTNAVISELMQIQDNLLTLGAVIAGSQKVELEPSQIKTLETRIDFYQQHTREDWYQHFLLPGGTEVASRLDVARTVCRRLERLMVYYLEQQSLMVKLTLALQFINRLSDYLFALRCYLNSQANYKETEFKPSYTKILNPES